MNRRKILLALGASISAGLLHAKARVNYPYGLFVGKDIPSASSAASVNLQIDFFVRHDGTATSVINANDPSNSSSSLNLQSLFDESLAGNIPPGSVVGFSDQGGIYSTFPDRNTLYIAQVYLANGVTYTNVLNENPYFYPVGQKGGIGNRGPHNFLASPTPNPGPSNPHIDNPDTAIISVNSTGSISVKNDHFASNVEIHGSSGSAGDGYGIKIYGLDILGNYSVGGVGNGGSNDAYSTSGSAELEIFEGTISNIYNVENPTYNKASSQAFTSHDNSKLRAHDVICDHINQYSTPVGNSTMELYRCHATNIYSYVFAGAGPSYPGPTAIIEDAVIDTGDPNTGEPAYGSNLALTSARRGVRWTSQVISRCKVTARYGAVTGHSGSWGYWSGIFGGDNCVHTYNDCAFTFDTGSTNKGFILQTDRSELFYNDCSFVFLNDTPSARWQISDPDAVPKLQFNRCVFDDREANATNNDIVALKADTNFTAGSGMYACEIWGLNHNALFSCTVSQDLTIPRINFPLQQCTVLQGGYPEAHLIAFDNSNTNGYLELTNCHFSGFGINFINDNERMDTLLFNCSFWDTTTNQSTNMGAVILDNESEESFSDKYADPPDLHISALSHLYQAGISAPPGATHDRDGLPFLSPNASIGAYEIGELDDDNDGVPNHIDNCIEKPNGPKIPDAGGNVQLDSDGDGFGNLCDSDFNNNGVTDPGDFSLLKSRIGQTNFPVQDLNGNGIVDPGDFSSTKANFGKPPGPSGLVP